MLGNTCVEVHARQRKNKQCQDCKFWQRREDSNTRWGNCTHPKCLRDWYKNGHYKHTDGRYATQMACKKRFEPKDKTMEDISRIMDNLEEMAAILKEDIVQCSECVHLRRDSHGRPYCSLMDRATRDENFCSWGENNDAELG